MDTQTRYYKDTTSGVEVTIVNVTENRYEATIVIPVCILKCRQLKLNNQHFAITITPKVLPEELVDDIVTVRIKRGYVRGAMGLVKDRNAILKFDEPVVSGELVLKPRFYILPEERYNKKNIKRKSEEKKARRRMSEKEPETLMSKLNPFKKD